jgi:hypothetical protein
MATNRWYTNSTNIIVDYTTAEASDVENKLNDVANALDTVEGEFDDLKEQSLKFNPSGGETPGTEYTGTLADMKETIIGFDSNGDMTLYPGDLSGYVWDGNVTRIDIDGATDIGADLTDDDLIVVDDGGTGTNRKSALSRIWTWLKGKTDAPIGMLDVKGGTDIGGALYETDLVVVADPASGAVRKSALSRIWTLFKTFLDAPVTMIDIDGATDIGADLADGDLLIVDDGATGTNRKTALSRVASYAAEYTTEQLNTGGQLRGTENMIDNVNFILNGRGYIPVAYGTGAGGSFPLFDRWSLQKVGGYAVTPAYNSIPTKPYFGASTGALSLHITTADPTLAAGDYLHLDQWFEPNTVKVLGWGTPGAMPAIMSFYLVADGLAASTTYTIAAAVRGFNGSTVDRSCCVPITFTTDSSGEFSGRLTAAFPGTTAGSFMTQSTAGDIGVSFACGSTFTAPTAGVWHASNYLGVPGQSNFASILNARVFLSEFMFVPGTVAPDPARIQRYELDYLNCRRYSQFIQFPGSQILPWNCGTGIAYLRVPIRQMHTTPTCVWSSGGLDFTGAAMSNNIGNFGLTGLAVTITPESNTMVLLSVSSPTFAGGTWGLQSAVGSVMRLDADPTP